MKKILLSLVAIATLSLSTFGQAPEGFKYQAVVRDAGGLILNNQAVGMRLTVQQGSIGGVTVYSETFSTTTNGYGLVNLEIGTGTTAYDFSTIDWGNGPYFMETAVDVTGGTSYAVMGTSQLMSVPYALHSKTAENVTNDLVDDADADPTNELQDWSNLPGIPAELADGTDDVDDADADPTNELQDWSNLPGIPAGLSDGIDNVDDADSDSTNELQDWSNLPGIPAGLSDGTDDVDDADSDPTNELQDWSNLPGIPAELADGTDDVDDADADPTNELQALSVANDTLYLSNGNSLALNNFANSSTSSNWTNAEKLTINSLVANGSVNDIDTLFFQSSTVLKVQTTYSGTGYIEIVDLQNGNAMQGVVKYDHWNYRRADISCNSSEIYGCASRNVNLSTQLTMNSSACGGCPGNYTAYRSFEIFIPSGKSVIIRHSNYTSDLNFYIITTY